ncbi:uncharacterized protein LOC125943340 [Dermacentor silvarum]|uniref:uncharacterized protein LOC125943340 n=1 Tax=Dermacentor silvarum TaxID=543639 RepID=UPI002100BA73|nr:uncharacterized protein LOC125943340 [Dermacentor silvarum]
MAAFKCTFVQDWTNPKHCEFAAWVRPVECNANAAYCTLCRKQFSLSNMGRRAVTSHAESKKHRLAASGAKTPSVASFLTPPAAVVIKAGPVASGSALPSSSSTTATDSQPERATKDIFQRDTEVIKAEVMWCLNAVMTHTSLRAAAASASLFPLMFPSSATAKKMQLGKDKVGYTIVHGLAPFFRESLVSEVSQASHLVVAFDESLNNVAQKEQMDVLVRFWSDAEESVKTRYLTSCFLGHTRAEELVSAFKSATDGLSRSKILQISMDGPNVNMKFLREIKQELCESSDGRQILDVGSCGLHVVNGAFKTGHAATGWQLVEFLRAIYNLFKCVPARRAEYARITGSNVYPLKFCAVRWLENVSVISRALEVLPYLKVYIESCRNENKRPTSASYGVVETAIRDPLLSAKLTFMLRIAEELQPFLAQFQTDLPMLPFLGTALENLLRSLMSTIVKKEVMMAADSPLKLINVDMDQPANVVATPKIDLGFATKNALRKALKLSDLAILEFKRDCAAFVKNCAKKIVERSPLKFKLTRGSSSLDPACALIPELGERRLTDALEVLTEHQWMTGAEADRAMRSYKLVCSLASTQAALKNFDRSTDRLDALWAGICGSNKELLAFAKIILTLSHGNASVERGFSINKSCLVENQKELSLVAQRIIFDAVSSAGGVASVQLTKRMFQMVRGANARWKEELEKTRKERADEMRNERERKRVAASLKELELKKKSVG